MYIGYGLVIGNDALLGILCVSRSTNCHFVLCYDLTEIGERQVFYLAIKEVIDDYEIYVNGDDQQKTAINQKYESIAFTHRHALEVA